MKYFFISLIILTMTACGQSNSKDNQKARMDLNIITNENVKAAIEALQRGDQSWYSFFIENPIMTDDGNPKDFNNFFEGALGKEKFLTIYKVENNGKDIYGDFKAGIWGTFKVYFKFHENADGKFDQLHIGQVKN